MKECSGQIGYARRSQFYRVEYDEIRDIPFFLSFINKGVTTVLEAPCGAGRLTIELAKKAKHVTAIDIEPLMKSSLENFAFVNGLSHRITALLGDIGELHLGQKYDLIIVPSEALQLFPKGHGRKVYRCLVEHLNQNGKLIFDLATFNERQSGQPSYFDPQTYGREWHRQWTRSLPESGKLTRSVRFTKTPASHHFEFLYQLESDNSSTVTFSEEMILYSYEIDWFFRDMPKCISSIKVLSSYDGSGELDSPSRYIIVVQKEGIALQYETQPS